MHFLRWTDEVDGPGNTAGFAYVPFVDGNNFPRIGVMVFDIDDIQPLKNQSYFDNVVRTNILTSVGHYLKHSLNFKFLSSSQTRFCMKWVTSWALAICGGVEASAQQHQKEYHRAITLAPLQMPSMKPFRDVQLFHWKLLLIGQVRVHGPFPVGITIV